MYNCNQFLIGLHRAIVDFPMAAESPRHETSPHLGILNNSSFIHSWGCFYKFSAKASQSIEEAQPFSSLSGTSGTSVRFSDYLGPTVLTMKGDSIIYVFGYCFRRDASDSGCPSFVELAKAVHWHGMKTRVAERRHQSNK